MSCGACQSSLVDLRSEMDLKASIAKSLSQEFSRTSAQTTISLDLGHVYSSRLRPITSIQSHWRGYQERKAVNHLLRSQDRPNSYFTQAYVQETLRIGQPLVRNIDFRPAYRYCNGSSYIGEWRGGFRFGQGIMTWSDGARFQGNWMYGYPSGIGVFTLSTGESFDGTWKYSKSCLRMSLLLDSDRLPNDGYGKNHTVWLAIREIQAEEGKIQPQRTWQSAKKAALEEAVQNVKSQLCSVTKQPKYKGGGRVKVEKMVVGEEVYTGEMRENVKDGWGRNEWITGDRYEGEWERGQHHGFGISSWADGSRHIGYYSSNQKSGIGEYTWEDGSLYLGEWQDNQMHGKGKYSWSDGRVYLGEWVNGQMHGFGVFTWKDERRYEGGWYQGKKHGEGVTYTPDGRYSRDIWKHGKMIKPDV